MRDQRISPVGSAPRIPTQRGTTPRSATRSRTWRPPFVWRVLLLLAAVLVPLVCRLRVVNEIPDTLRGRPLILACNHIGTFDPIALTAACRRLGLAPRILATGGLFRTPVVGAVLRRCGHIRVNRSESSAVDALGSALSAVREGSVVAGYPEGRITLHPGMWPERARSGLARLALASEVPVIPVSQWGAHEVMVWHGWLLMMLRLAVSSWRRPVVWVRFGGPVDLSGLDTGVPRHTVSAASRIMAAVTEGLRPLRAAEPSLPRYVDPTRPVSTARGFVAAQEDSRPSRL